MSDDPITGPRAAWRTLPEPVVPENEGQAVESDASLWDRAPAYDPNIGFVRER